MHRNMYANTQRHPYTHKHTTAERDAHITMRILEKKNTLRRVRTDTEPERLSCFDGRFPEDYKQTCNYSETMA